MGRLVEVDEDELLQSRQLRETVKQMYANPKARKLAEQAHKLINPNAATPALDEDAEREAPIRALEKTVNDFITAQKTEREKEVSDRQVADFQRKIEGEYADLRAAGWLEDAITEVKKLAEEKSLMPSDAAVLYEKHHPPQALVAPSGRSGPWNFMEPDEGSENIKSLIASGGNNDRILDKMINEGLRDHRGQSQQRR